MRICEIIRESREDIELMIILRFERSIGSLIAESKMICLSDQLPQNKVTNLEEVNNILLRIIVSDIWQVNAGLDADLADLYKEATAMYSNNNDLIYSLLGEVL